MPAILKSFEKIKPLYDIVYKVTLIICKLLLIADIAITTKAGGSDIDVLHGCAFRSFGYPQWFPYSDDVL